MPLREIHRVPGFNLNKEEKKVGVDLSKLIMKCQSYLEVLGKISQISTWGSLEVLEERTICKTSIFCETDLIL